MVKEFWQLVKVWLSDRYELGGNIFDTQCINTTTTTTTTTTTIVIISSSSNIAVAKCTVFSCFFLTMGQFVLVYSFVRMFSWLSRVWFLVSAQSTPWKIRFRRPMIEWRIEWDVQLSI